MQKADTPRPSWLDRPIHGSLPDLRLEHVLFGAVLLLALFTRFYDLGSRVMSHDESLHTYFSWLLYRGQGYDHSPMMHGPLQFHLIALSYFLFGASDFTSRIPAALFGIATVAFMWKWRPYLGRLGALVAALLLTISPYMLFYARYTRNEAAAAFSGVVMLYALLRYLGAGAYKYLYVLAGALALHFVSKETSFIYAIQAFAFLALYLVARITRKPWPENERLYSAFLIALALALLLGAVAVGMAIVGPAPGLLTSTETAAPANPEQPVSPLEEPVGSRLGPPAYLALAAGLLLAAAVGFLLTGYTWKRLRTERAFDLLVVLAMICIPMATAFPLKWLEPWLHVSIPTGKAEVDALAGNQTAILTIGAVMITLFAIAAVIGVLWDRSRAWKIALVFWIPFIVFYTTVFTNTDGFFTGAIGSLGYWLVQQGVERGSQPWYYYLGVQLPMYEYLPAIGFVLALVLGLVRGRKPSTSDGDVEESNFIDMFGLLAFWGVTSLIAYSYAGEKMPWLTVHITWPMILLTAWALGRLIARTDWGLLIRGRAATALLCLALLVAAMTSAAVALLGPNPPFQGRELENLQATGAFLLPALIAIGSAAALVYLRDAWPAASLARVAVLAVFLLFAVLTARTAFRAAYITYDQATEFLVYAHSARAVKDVTEQAREISERTTGGMGVSIAYDASAPDTGVSWPFVWYLRDFTNQRSFDQPTRSLRDAAVVIVDQKNFEKIDAALGPGYLRQDMIRMWWPMQDYFGIPAARDPAVPFPETYSCRGLLGFLRLFRDKDYSRFCDVFTNPAVRAGVMKIWLTGEFDDYAQASGRTDLTLTTWQPADQMRLYVRRDVASQVWNYGVPIEPAEEIVDPTEDKYAVLTADAVLDAMSAVNPVALNAPRALAFARNGSMYVADTRNHRILHLEPDGRLIREWGSFADGSAGPAAPGTFNEPWGVAVGIDGSVYVSDTWNHRIQKFTATGTFISSWGTFGQGETPESLYGPRGLAVDEEGNVLVADTGNKRIVVFDRDGTYLMQFGTPGFDPGQFDEPTSVTVDSQGRVYVADAWNQRVQTFLKSADGFYTPERQWDVYGWFSRSAENKPYIAVDAAGRVFVTDPESSRVQQFTGEGELVQVWGEFGNTLSTFGLAGGIAVDAEGHVWVTDVTNNRLMRFTVP